MGSVTEGGKSSTGEGVRDLSDKLTADKIAALKNKRKKNMARNTIKSVDDRFVLWFYIFCWCNHGCACEMV